MDLAKQPNGQTRYWAIGPFGRRNKYIKHRTTAIGQLTAALPTTRRCQVCVRLSLAKEGNFAHCPLFPARHGIVIWRGPLDQGRGIIQSSDDNTYGEFNNQWRWRADRC